MCKCLLTINIRNLCLEEFNSYDLVVDINIELKTCIYTQFIFKLVNNISE